MASFTWGTQQHGLGLWEASCHSGGGDRGLIPAPQSSCPTCEQVLLSSGVAVMWNQAVWQWLQRRSVQMALVTGRCV
jgi:hypothetical protein